MTRSFKFAIGLRRRVLLIGLIAAIPGLLLLFSAFAEQRDRTRSAAEAQAVTSVRQIARAHEQAVERGKTLASVLSDVELVRSGPAAACSRYLASIREHAQGLFTNIVRVDPDGRIRCSAVPLPGSTADTADGIAATPNPTLIQAQAARSPQVFVGEYVISRITRKATLSLFASMLGPRSDPLGLVAVGVDLSELQAQPTEANLPSGSELTLVDRQGTVLNGFPPDPARMGQPAPIAARLLREVGERREGLVRFKEEPGRLYPFYRLSDSRGTGPLFYASAPLAAIDEAVDSNFLRNLLGLFVALTAMIGGGVLTGHWLVVRPIERLRQVSGRLAEGDLAARSELGPGRDEVAALGASFDRMAASLQARDAALRERQIQVERLNRVYVVLSSINGLIIRAGPQKELLTEACRIVVERGGFLLAWIGLLDAAGGRWTTVETAGPEPAGEAGLVPAVGDLPGDWPELKEVFALGRPAVYPPLGEAPRWRGQAPDAYAGCVALPLRRDATVIGCMALYTPQGHVIDALEMQLLAEMAADISHALAHLAQAEHLAYVIATDLLTGLPNALRFRERLELTLDMLRREAGGVELAVMLVDLHTLRNINAVHGLHIGDEVLRAAAARLRGLLPPDTKLARLRGGVFGMLLPQQPGTDTITTTIQRILESFSGPLPVGELALPVNVRIGISLWPADADEAEVLIQHAETALSNAGATPEHFRFFMLQLQQQAEQRLALEGQLHQALARDEFHLLYQPVVAVATRWLVGVEALIRWRHPTLGDIAPSRFVPVAEAAGLMLPLGSWVMREAFRQARRWAADGLAEFKVAVNVAASQLKHPDFLKTVDEAVAAAAVDPRLVFLGVELTETELMEDAAQAIELLKALKARGFALSIDDFGTGYSSLAYLERFPLDVLKIDIAFIRDLAHNPASGSIVQAIIALAEALKLATIAEGVETPEQFQRLAQYGCHAVQGFLFGRAMPPETIPELAGRTLAVDPV